MRAAYTAFEFDLPTHLRDDLVLLLERMDEAALTRRNTARIPDAQGVYQLFYNGVPVYIGKTDSEAGLRTRLSRHARKILHRPSLTGKVTFKAIRVMVFTAMDLETELIKYYRNKHGKEWLPWNGSGFGSNDPGTERETTRRRPDGFDQQYPIDITLPRHWVAPGNKSVAEVLADLKARLPYTLRYQTAKPRSRKPHPEMQAARMTIPRRPQSVRELMWLISRALGPRWQAVRFDSHVILYQERRKYKWGEKIKDPSAKGL
jgi:hypothetical protein